MASISLIAVARSLGADLNTARIDELTGLYNRRGFLAVASRKLGALGGCLEGFGFGP